MADATPSRPRLTERQAAVLAAVERLGRPMMADLWEQFPDLAPSAIKKVLDSLEKKGLVDHAGDQRQVYLNGVHWWSTALEPTKADPGLDVILAALRQANVEVEYHADVQEGCVTVFVALVEIEGDLQGLPSATLDRFRSCVRDLDADGTPIHLRIAGITAGPEPLVTVKVQPSADGRDPRLKAGESRPIRLRPVAERDAAMREHVETTHFFDEETGELYEPKEPPEVPGWGEDGDDDDTSPETTSGP